MKPLRCKRGYPEIVLYMAYHLRKLVLFLSYTAHSEHSESHTFRWLSLLLLYKWDLHCCRYAHTLPYLIWPLDGLSVFVSLLMPFIVFFNKGLVMRVCY